MPTMMSRLAIVRKISTSNGEQNTVYQTHDYRVKMITIQVWTTPDTSCVDQSMAA
jgi:hypothetical protein